MWKLVDQDIFFVPKRGGASIREGANIRGNMVY